jgi:hypothetical protein
MRLIRGGKRQNHRPTYSPARDNKRENSAGLRALVRKTGLGYGPDIRWERLGGIVEDQERSEEEGSDEDEFGGLE